MKNDEKMKNLHGLSKNAKICDVKMLTQLHSIRNYAAFIYKTLEEVPWHPGQKELKNWLKFSEKLKKLRKLV